MAARDLQLLIGLVLMSVSIGYYDARIGVAVFGLGLATNAIVEAPKKRGPE